MVTESPLARRAAVLAAVREHIQTHNDAFYVVDLSEVSRKFELWRSELPRVRPFFAVKCNDDPKIVETLAKLGAGFDCASKGEMSMVLKLTGASPTKDIIFAHPAKQPSHLQYARSKGVVRMTFDNEDELRKIAREHPGAEVVLRILTDDSHSVCRLGLKFGAPLSQVGHLLSVAKELNLKAVGISYHVGSGNGNAQSFGDAVRDARSAFDIAEGLGIKLTLLDIGGGFPGSELGSQPGMDKLGVSQADADNPYAKHPSFKVIAGVVREALDKYFPEGCGVDLMAEPGRFFTKSTHALAVNVVGKRKTVDEGGQGTRINYYVNDGLYGSFNCVMYDHVTCAPSLVLKQSTAAAIPLTATAPLVDDAIAKLNADGTPAVSDAVGLPHALNLMQAAAPDAETETQVNSRRMVLGGDDEEESISGIGSANAGTTTFGRFAATIAAAAAVAGSQSAARRSAPMRAYSHASLAPQASGSTTMHPTTIWGPTCDSIDKITDSIKMPEVAIGDWLVFENMGAYTIAGSCKFNGFPLSTKVYLHTDGSVEVQREEEHE